MFRWLRTYHKPEWYEGVAWFNPARNEVLVTFIGCNRVVHVILDLWFWVKYLKAKSDKRLFDEMCMDEQERQLTEAQEKLDNTGSIQ